LQRWKISINDVESGGHYEIEAEVLFYAIGGFMAPQFPKELKGVEEFKGIAWHSARWRHDVSLEGKRVGVIGNGCSS
jgi:cation diffusion facilitator CzcD-associated flavoprotein CzcO